MLSLSYECTNDEITVYKHYMMREASTAPRKMLRWIKGVQTGYCATEGL